MSLQPQAEVHCSTRQQFWETGPQELLGPIFEFLLSNGEVSLHHLTLRPTHTACPKAASQQHEQPVARLDGTRSPHNPLGIQGCIPTTSTGNATQQNPKTEGIYLGYIMKCSTKPSWHFTCREDGSCILRGKKTTFSQIFAIQKSTGNIRGKSSLSVVFQSLT